jgi:hypothetical protein
MIAEQLRKNSPTRADQWSVASCLSFDYGGLGESAPLGAECLKESTEVRQAFVGYLVSQHVALSVRSFYGPNILETAQAF